MCEQVINVLNVAYECLYHQRNNNNKTMYKKISFFSLGTIIEKRYDVPLYLNCVLIDISKMYVDKFDRIILLRAIKIGKR